MEPALAAFAEQLSTFSALIDRASLVGEQFRGKRDTYAILGYEKEPTFEHYWTKYDRQDVAGRIVDLPAQTTWRKPPKLIPTDGDGDAEEAFFEQFEALAKRLRLWHYFERVDRIAGIGRYAVLLIGVKGEPRLKQEMPNLGGPDDVLYLSPFREDHAKIESWVTDPKDPRFGKPQTYKIDLSSGVKGFKAKREEVHWSRVIHVAENLSEDEVYGRPRLRRVLNLLDDMVKVAGGSAESFWQNAARTHVLSLDKDAKVSEKQMEELSEKAAEVSHGLRQLFQIQGGTLDTLGGETADPRGSFEVAMTLMAAAAGIPKRILFGSERGELASSQDRAEWLGSIASRQESFAEPVIVRQLVDRLIDRGGLAEPSAGYDAKWPELFQLSELEAAEASEHTANAIDKYASGAGGTVVPQHEFRETVLGLPASAPGDPSTGEFIKEEDDKSTSEIEEIES